MRRTCRAQARLAQGFAAAAKQQPPEQAEVAEEVEIVPAGLVEPIETYLGWNIWSVFSLRWMCQTGFLYRYG